MHLSVLLFLGCILAAVRADSSGSGSSYNDDDNVTFSALRNALQNDVGVSAFSLEPDTWYNGPYLYSNCDLDGYDTRVSFEIGDGKFPFASCRDTASRSDYEVFQTYKVAESDNNLQCALAKHTWGPEISDCNNPRTADTGLSSHLVLRPRYRLMFENCAGYHLNKLTEHATLSEQKCVEMCDANSACLAFATCNNQAPCGSSNCILYSVFNTAEIASILRCWQDQYDDIETKSMNFYDKNYYRYDHATTNRLSTMQTVFPHCRARAKAAINTYYTEDNNFKLKGKLEYKMSKTKCEAYCNTMPDCVGITLTSYQCLFLKGDIYDPNIDVNIDDHMICGGPEQESFKYAHTYTKNAFLNTNQLLPVSTQSAVAGYGIPIILTCSDNTKIISITDVTFDSPSSCGNAINDWLQDQSYCNSQNDCSIFCNQVGNDLLCTSDKSATPMICPYSDFVEMTVEYDCVSSVTLMSTSTKATTQTATTTKLGEESSYVMYKFIGCTGSGDFVKGDATFLDACFDECIGMGALGCNAVMFEDSECRLYESGTVSNDNCYDTSSNGDGTLYLRPYFEYKKDDSAGLANEIGTRENFETVSQCATKCFNTSNCEAIATKEQDSEPKFECILYSSIQTRVVPGQKATWYDLKYFGRSDSQTIFSGCRGLGYRKSDGTLMEKDTIIGRWEDGYHLNQRSELITKGACEAYCNTVPECKAITLSNKQCLMHNTIDQTPLCNKENRDKQSTYYVKEAFSTSNQLTTSDICTGIRGRDGAGTPVGILCPANQVIDTVNAAITRNNLEACPASTPTTDTCHKALQIFTETCCKGKQHCYLRCLNQEQDTCFCTNTGATYKLDTACAARPYYGINGTCVLPSLPSGKKKHIGWKIFGYSAAGCAGIGLIVLIFKGVNRCRTRLKSKKQGKGNYNFTQMFQL